MPFVRPDPPADPYRSPRDSRGAVVQDARLKVGGCRLYIGARKHGVSVYGWKQGRDAGFTTRHPELTTSTGTIRLRPEEAAGISDEEFRDLVRSALTPG